MSSMVLPIFSVAVVPFPFTDRNANKRRPALLLSSEAFQQSNGHSVMAMITSAEQSRCLGDHPVMDLESAGLPSACVVRLKLFTLDHRLILRQAGVLALTDQRKLRRAWKGLVVL